MELPRSAVERTSPELGIGSIYQGRRCDASCAKPKLSGRKLEGCYSLADDSPAGSRSRAAGLPLDCKPHGLRKTLGRRLADAGVSAHDIMAALGHTTLAQAELYTKEA